MTVLYATVLAISGEEEDFGRALTGHAFTEVCTKSSGRLYPAQQVSLMGQNPEELLKAHSNAHAKVIIVGETATVMRK